MTAARMTTTPAAGARTITRTLAALCLSFALLVPTARAQVPAVPQVIDLWPEGALPAPPNNGPERVGSDGSARGAVTNVSRPRIEVYRPARPNGTAVLVLGGGGYFRIQVGTAARPVAQWLSALGVTTAVLYYRMPVDGWKAEAPFQDAQRAMRVLRAHAGELGIDPARIGVIGSSAGANLGGIIATRADFAFYPPVDDVDAQPSRPDFLGMLYPVVSLRAPLDTTRSRRELGTQPDAVEAYSVELHVDGRTPPTFLAHAADDPIADVRHSLLMFDALREHEVPAELHVFETGGHSWGLGKPGTAPSAWPRLFADWMRGHGWLPAPGTAVAANSPAEADADAAIDEN